MITPRLEMILRHVNGKICADIGTDHAYVPIELAKRGVRVIATDIMPGPLSIAEENVAKSGVDVELRLGGGLEPVNMNEVDTVIIAGMGGEMIEKILSEAPEKAQGVTLILQPMNRQYELRTFLMENGYRIISEDISVEGFKVYNLIVAKFCGQRDFSGYEKEIDRHLPKCLYNNVEFDKLCAKKNREFSKILLGLLKSKEQDSEEIKRLTLLLCEIKEIEENLGYENK